MILSVPDDTCASHLVDSTSNEARFKTRLPVACASLPSSYNAFARRIDLACTERQIDQSVVKTALILDGNIHLKAGTPSRCTYFRLIVRTKKNI